MDEQEQSIQYPSKSYIMKCFLNPNMYLPDMSISSISDLNLGHMERFRGITAYVLDADHTLLGFKYISIDEALEAKFHEIRENYRMCILTNSPGKRRADLVDYFRGMGVDVIETKYLKPRLRAFNDALSYLGTGPSSTALVSDMCLDIFGANIAGMYSVKVDSLKAEGSPVYVRAVLGFDKCFDAMAHRLI